MPRHPQQLRRSEAGHRKIARDGVQRGAALFELSALGLRTAVVPENGRAQRAAVGAKQGGPVHLTGKPDAANYRDFARMGGGKIVDGADRRIDPGVRILLGPERRGMR